MSPEAQRIAIAEACGRVQRPDGFWFPKGANYGSQGIPNYLNDLNAMHEAEILIRKNYDIYGAYLQYLNRTAPECRVHANAGQKAEAFLRAIGKWEEEAKP